MKNFQVKLSDELHEMLHKAAFATGKSKHQYILDAIRKEAERDSQSVQISYLPQQESKESD